MLSDREKLEYDVLTIIRDANGPMGCGSLAVKLQSLGHSVSEATVGRILRDLDFAGFTEKAGFRGRKLSADGQGRLAKLENKDRRLKWGQELMAAVQGHTKEQLLEVLVARRVIESELAYLAAKNASKLELASLKAILDRQRYMLECGDGAATEDVDFHNIIALMSRNRVLAAAIALIRQDTQLSPILEHIRLHVQSLVYVDHQKIVENIANGQADEAKASMVEHINNLIRDVERYWENIEQQQTN